MTVHLWQTILINLIYIAVLTEPSSDRNPPDETSWTEYYCFLLGNSGSEFLCLKIRRVYFHAFWSIRLRLARWTAEAGGQAGSIATRWGGGGGCRAGRLADMRMGGYTSGRGLRLEDGKTWSQHDDRERVDWTTCWPQGERKGRLVDGHVGLQAVGTSWGGYGGGVWTREQACRLSVWLRIRMGGCPESWANNNAILGEQPGCYVRLLEGFPLNANLVAWLNSTFRLTVLFIISSWTYLMVQNISW